MFELDRVRRKELPPASIAIGVVTLIVYAVEVLRAHGTSPDAEQLLALGASQRHAVWEGHELWRLLCPAFLHGSIIHIALNGYSFVQLAPFIERIWGWARFLVVYVVAAIAGAALSSRASTAISVGASGALFGLCGFLLVAAYSGTHLHEVRTIVRGTWGQGLLLSLGVILVYGFTPGSHIDNLAHVGGGIAGAVLGLILVETEEDDVAMRAMGAGAALAIVAAWVALALDARKTAQFEAEGRLAESAFASGQFVAAADACERALALRPRDPRGRELILLEGLAYLRADKLDEAAYTLERAWRNEPVADIAALLVEAHWRRGDKAAARSWSEQLHELETPAGIAAMNLPPEARAAIAAVDSR